jgi:hypothetical protein
VTITNAGTIQGSGGVAVSFNSASDRLIAELDSHFGGALKGGGGVLELAGAGVETITGLGGAGQLSGALTASFSGFGTYLIDPGVTISLSGSSTIAQGHTLTNDGPLTIASGATLKDYGVVELGGALTLGGAIVGYSGAGVDLLAGGVITLGGSIGGGGGLSGTGGSSYQGGAGAAGVSGSSAGTITSNSGAITGGNGGSGTYYFGPGAGGAGGVGVGLGAGLVTNNGGAIAGGSGGAGVSGYDVGGSGGAGGDGVSLANDGTIANTGGAITGGQGGAGGWGGYFGGSGGGGGAGVDLSGGGTLANIGGTIAGGSGGGGGSGAYGAGSGGAGGDGIDIWGVGTVVNGSAAATDALVVGARGVYAGGGGAATVISFGTIEGLAGVAVQFNATGDRLVAEAGAIWIGVVVGGGGALELAGGTGTITGLGGAGTLSGAEAMTFSGFGSYMVDAGASWTLAGGHSLSAGQTLANAGTLSGGLALTARSDRLIIAAGSILNGPVAGGGGVLELAGGAGTITGLGATGTLSGAAAMTFSGFGAYALDAGASWTLKGSHTLATNQTLTNAGTLSGSLALGAASDRLIIASGTVVNSTVAGGGGVLELAGGTGTISGLGATGTLSGAAAMTFKSFGAYAIDAGGNWTLTGASKLGAGQSLTVVGALNNDGALTETGATGVTLSGGGSVDNAMATSLISGTIGVYAGAGGAASVINFGTIKGTGGTAVQFASTGDRLIAEAGSHVTGAVKGGGGALELAGGIGTITGLGVAGMVSGAVAMTFSGFGSYAIDAGGAWTLSGANTLGSSQTLAVAGALTNNGALNASGASGVDLSSGGSLINTAGGLISGIAGVYAGASGATVSNFGTITGSGGTSVQFGASGDRLIAEAGSTWNGAVKGGGGTLELANGTGTISGLGSAGTLSGAEAMSFSGFGSYLIDAGADWTLAGGLAAGKTLTNAGTLSGGVALAAASDRLILESGAAVTGNVSGGLGVLELAGGGGTISGLGASATLSGASAMTFGGFGSYVLDAGGSWTLAGANALGSGQSLAVAGAVTNDGVVDAVATAIDLATGGLLDNATAASLISGQTGVYAGAGGAATVINYGAIDGTGGDAVTFASASDRLIVEAGATFVGAVLGGGGTLELASGVGAISELGSAFNGFATYTVDAGGEWTFSGGNILAAGRGLSVAGAVTLAASGALTGGAGGAGGYGAQGGGGGTALVLAAATASLSNAGVISGGGGGPGGDAVYAGPGGAGGAGVKLAGTGAAIANAGTIVGGAGGRGGYTPDLGSGAGGFGGAGVLLAAAGTLTNTGVVTGGAGGESPASPAYSGAGGHGGAGVSLSAGGLITNNGGAITGGAGGNAIYGGYYGGGGGNGGAGVAIAAGGALVNATGDVVGGAAGSPGASPGGGHGPAGMAGDGVSLTASGEVVNGGAASTAALIEGLVGVYAGPGGAATVTNWGAIDGTDGVSVQLMSAADRLVVEAGSTWVGGVQGGAGVLELAGGTGTISGLGASGTLSGAEAMTFNGFGSYQLDSTGAWTLAGTDVLAADQTLSIAGSLAIAGSLTIAGTVTSAGTIAGLAGSKLIFKNADFVGGTLLSATQISVEGAGNILDGRTTSLTNQASLFLANSAALTIDGTVVNDGLIALNVKTLATKLIVGATGATLSGGGAITLGATALGEVTGATASATLTNADNTISGGGLIGAGKLVLINQASGLIEQTGSVALAINTGARTITNAGTIETVGSGGATIAGAVANSGVLKVYKGDMTVSGAVTGTGSAVINAGTLDFTAGFSQNVTFSGSTGELELADSRTYKGSISGFSTNGGTSLDLRDIGFVSASEATFSGTKTGGVLTVTDGTHTAKIKLAGNYLASTWTCSSDGAGGVIVVDPRAPSTPAFVAAMAGLGRSGTMSGPLIEPRSSEPAHRLAAARI